MALTPPSLAIVIVNYRTADYVIRCVAALAGERESAGPFEVVIVDGASGDGSAEKLATHFADAPWRDWVSVLPLDLNGGFGWANNQAMLRLLQRADPPDYIHILNPDTLVEPGAIAALLEAITADARLGGVSSQLLEPDGDLAASAFRFPSITREFLRGFGSARLARLWGVAPNVIEDAGPADWLTGASVLFRSAALRQSGLFDDGFFLYFEEVELMRRMGRLGWGFRLVPASRVCHIGGVATGVESGAQVIVRPYPAYRYEARRRFFTLAYGAGGLILANLAWLGGLALARVARPLQRTREDAVPRELPMTLAHGFWPRGRDSRRSAPRWDEPPGRAPAWTQQ